MSFLSTLTASIPVLPWAQWHTRRFQYCLLSQWIHSSLYQVIQIPHSIWQYLPWWTQESNLSPDRPISPGDWIIVISDASLQGWEPIVGTCGPREHGTLWFLVVPTHWSWEHLDIPTSHTGSENQVIDGQQKQEREKKSLQLLQLTAEIFALVRIHCLDLSVYYLPRPQNTLEDQENWKVSNHTEWILNLTHLKEIFALWQIPGMNLMVTQCNCQVPICYLFLSTGSGPGYPLPDMRHLVGLPFFPNCSDSPFFVEDFGRGGVSNNDCSILAKEVIVLPPCVIWRHVFQSDFLKPGKCRMAILIQT